MKVRAWAYKYDSEIVLVYEIEHDEVCVYFAYKGNAAESEYLK